MDISGFYALVSDKMLDIFDRRGREHLTWTRKESAAGGQNFECFPKTFLGRLGRRRVKTFNFLGRRELLVKFQIPKSGQCTHAVQQPNPADGNKHTSSCSVIDSPPRFTFRTINRIASQYSNPIQQITEIQ